MSERWWQSNVGAAEPVVTREATLENQLQVLRGKHAAMQATVTEALHRLQTAGWAVAELIVYPDRDRDEDGNLIDWRRETAALYDAVWQAIQTLRHGPPL